MNNNTYIYDSDDLHCHNYPAQGNMTCCLMGQKVGCIPTFLVAGAEMMIGTTTTLSTYLSENPQIRFHVNKEV